MDVLEQASDVFFLLLLSHGMTESTFNLPFVMLFVCRLTTRQRRYSSYFYHASGSGRIFYLLYCTCVWCLNHQLCDRYCRQSLVCVTIQYLIRSDQSMLKKENGLDERGSAGTRNRRGDITVGRQIHQVISKWILLSKFNWSQFHKAKNKLKNKQKAFPTSFTFTPSNACWDRYNVKLAKW